MKIKSEVGKCNIDTDGGIFVNRHIRPNELEKFQEIIIKAIRIRDNKCLKCDKEIKHYKFYDKDIMTQLRIRETVSCCELDCTDMQGCKHCPMDGMKEENVSKILKQLEGKCPHCGR